MTGQHDHLAIVVTELETLAMGVLPVDVRESANRDALHRPRVEGGWSGRRAISRNATGSPKDDIELSIELGRSRWSRMISVSILQQPRSKEGTARPNVRVDAVPASGPTSAARQSSWGRFLRLIVGLGLIGLPSWFLIPSLWRVSSSQGVVNGHVIIMTSPIDGIVTLAPPPVMQAVTAGSTLVRIEAAIVDRRRLEELEAEAATLTERVAAVKDRIRSAELLKDELPGQLSGLSGLHDSAGLARVGRGADGGDGRVGDVGPAGERGAPRTGPVRGRVQQPTRVRPGEIGRVGRPGGGRWGRRRGRATRGPTGVHQRRDLHRAGR